MTNSKKQNVDTRYVGFLPTVSETVPAKRAPELIPKRYMAVERLSAVLLTWNSLLACEFAMDSAAPAHPWTKIRRERMAMFLARALSGHWSISCQFYTQRTYTLVR